MKSKLIMFVMLLGIGSMAFAQGAKDGAIKHGKQLKAIEKTMLKENSDAKAVELIKAAKKARNQKDDYVKKAPGYGKAAANVESLKKFKKKLKKNDPEFQKLIKAHKDAQREKREYISTVDQKYKALYDQTKKAEATGK